jgi:hypothetical protein
MKHLIFISFIFIFNIQSSNAGCIILDSAGIKGLNTEKGVSEIQANQNFTDSNVVVSELKHPKRTAAILALTLGMLGAHRLFLGSKPWVPLFYVLTVGGVFFIIPVIDFLAIVTEKNTSKFYNNNSILMWLNK